MTATELDTQKLKNSARRWRASSTGAAAALMLSIGHRTGLFDVMAGLPPSTSEEIAGAAGLHERYVREWLGAMVTAGVVEYDSGGAAYVLPPEHAALTTRAAGPNNFAAVAQFVAINGGVESEVIDKFRNGGGVPYSSFARFHEAIADTTGAIFDANLVSSTLPAGSRHHRTVGSRHRRRRHRHRLGSRDQRDGEGVPEVELRGLRLLRRGRGARSRRGRGVGAHQRVIRGEGRRHARRVATVRLHHDVRRDP